MGIVAGLLVQNTLKFLLGFGQVSYYLGYNAMSNFFPVDVLRPNVDCGNRQCIARQREQREPWSPTVWRPAYDRGDDVPVVHDSNDWGIEVEGEDSAAGGSDAAVQPAVEAVGKESTKKPEFVPAAGLGFLHEASSSAPVAEGDVVNTGGLSLDELMQQMKGLSARK
jgi:ubiquitin-like modifier-activating enzyme 5